MQKITMLKAINQALDEELAFDERVVVFGEDVGYFGGCYGVTAGLFNKHGDLRVKDTPIAENTLVGAAVGMALGGLKPVPELMFADFAEIAFDEILNKMGKWKWMHGGCFDMPITLRLPTGMLGGAGPEHSQSTQGFFMHSQGLYLVVPSTPYDAKGLLKQAIRGNDPVLFFEHKGLYGMTGEVPEEEYFIPFGVADVKLKGTDVTVLATSLQVHTALAAAQELAKEGISVEVIDPRTLIPFDKATLFESIKKTGRLVIVHEEPKTGGTGAEIAAMVAEEAWFDLKAPIKRIGSPDVPCPHSVHLENMMIPSKEQIIAAVKETLK
ncbi:MAG: alpha-ketoacid dehydrogenase subunit beta [Sedimentibacter sp.]